MKQLLMVIAGLIAFLPVRAPAEHFAPLPLEELTAHAELIVHGTVNRLAAQKDGAGRIFTKIELTVHDVWKGRLGNGPLTVVQGGGILGRERTAVTGQAQFGLGEEVVLFLRKNPRGEAVTIGLAQGKFGLSGARDRRWVVNPIYRLASPGAPNAEHLELRQFKTRVRQHIR